MNRHPNFRAAVRQSVALTALALACATGQAQTAAPAAASAASAPAGPTVRAEMAAPLQAARELISAKKGKEALPRLAETEALPNLTPYETYVIARMKAVAAVDAGESALALENFEKAVASSFLPPADKLPLLDAMSRLAIQLKDYPRAAALLGR